MIGIIESFLQATIRTATPLALALLNNPAYDLLLEGPTRFTDLPAAKLKARLPYWSSVLDLKAL